MAARFNVNGGSANWTDTANWATSSGGAGGNSAPTVLDDVTFDSHSISTTIDTAAQSCKTLTCTGYTGTLTFTNNLTVAGNITLGSGMGFAGSGTLILTQSATINNAGLTCPQPFQLNMTSTTLTVTNWTNSGLVTFGPTGGPNTISGAIVCSGGLTINTTSFFGPVTMTGGTLQTTGGGALRGRITFAGNVTLSGTILLSNGGAFTYSSGTITTAGSTISCGASAGVGSFICAGMTFDTFTSDRSNITLGSDLACNTLNLGSSGGNTTFSGAFNITAGAANLSGTQLITLSGNVTVSGLTSITGNLHWAGAFTWATGTMTSGTTTITVGSGGGGVIVGGDMRGGFVN